MHWRIKASIFSLLRFVPFSGQVLYGLQRYATREWPRRPASLDLLLVAAQRIAAAASRHSQGRTFLEIGAGGDLAIALALRMLGAERVTCIDVTRMAHLSDVQHAASYLASKLARPEPLFRAWGDLEAFGVVYRAPARAQEVRISQVDCLCSVDTLEHIPTTELTEVLHAGIALVKADGCCVHLIDYSDHFARGTTISRFNFLLYDDDAWKPFNTRFHYVNRLRHSEYLSIFRNLGLNIESAETDAVHARDDIRSRLASRFAGMSDEDLFTLRAMIVAKHSARVH